MMRRISMALTGAAVMLLVVSAKSATAAEIDNPAYAAWTNFKPGSTVSLKHTMHMNSGGMNMDRTFQSTSKLVEVTAEKATIEVTTDMEGQKSTHKQDIPAKVEATSAKAPKYLGEQTITVGGKSYSYKMYDMVMEPNGAVVHAKVWLSGQVPGGTVKVESSITHGQMKMTDEAILSAYDAK